jgi:hypothetical protein
MPGLLIMWASNIIEVSTVIPNQHQKKNIQRRENVYPKKSTPGHKMERCTWCACFRYTCLKLWSHKKEKLTSVMDYKYKIGVDKSNQMLSYYLFQWKTLVFSFVSFVSKCPHSALLLKWQESYWVKHMNYKTITINSWRQISGLKTFCS